MAMKKPPAVLMLATLIAASFSFGSSDIHWFSLQEGAEKAKAGKNR